MRKCPAPGEVGIVRTSQVLLCIVAGALPLVGFITASSAADRTDDAGWPFGDPQMVTSGSLGQPVVADFHGDTTLDLWVATSRGGEVITPGDPNLEPVQLDTDSSYEPGPATAVDLNGDGVLEIVQVLHERDAWASRLRVVSWSDERLEVLWESPTGPRVYDVEAFDFDRDGDPDIAVAQWWSDEIAPRWFRNDAGSLEKTSFEPVADSGLSSILLPVSTSALLTGGNPFPSQTLGSEQRDIPGDRTWHVRDAVAADLTGDGATELFLARGDNGIAIDETPVGESIITIPRPRIPMHLEIDGDELDLAIRVGETTEVIALDPDELATWETRFVNASWSDGSWTVEVTQGPAVILVKGNSATITVPDQHRKVAQPLQVVSGPLTQPLYSIADDASAHCEAVVTGDLDGDGDADVVAGCSDGSTPGRLVLLRNRGDATFEHTSRQLLASASTITDLQLTDLDDDGQLDLVVSVEETITGERSLWLASGTDTAGSARLDLGPTGLAAEIKTLGPDRSARQVVDGSGIAYIDAPNANTTVVVTWADGEIDVLQGPLSNRTAVTKGAWPNRYIAADLAVSSQFVVVEEGSIEVLASVSNAGTAEIPALDVELIRPRDNEVLLSQRVTQVDEGATIELRIVGDLLDTEAGDALELRLHTGQAVLATTALTTSVAARTPAVASHVSDGRTIGLSLGAAATGLGAVTWLAASVLFRSRQRRKEAA